MRNAVFVVSMLSLVGISRAEDKLVNATEEVAAVTTVAPGKVHWKESFDAAVLAARDTGKPVLHFELLGRLDQELC